MFVLHYPVKVFRNPLAPPMGVLYKTLAKSARDIDIVLPFYQGTRFENKWKSVFPFFPDIFTHIMYHTRFPGVVNVKEAYLKDQFYIDRYGYGPWSEMAVRDMTQEINSSFPNHQENRSYLDNFASGIGAGTMSKYKQNDVCEPHLPGEYILCIGQVQNDRVMSEAFMSSQDMIESALAAARNLGLPVVFKPHPRDETVRFQQYVASKTAEIDFFVSNGNIYRLFHGAACVCTVNSGAGFEAMIQGVPVCNFGRADYALYNPAISCVGESWKIVDAAKRPPDHRVAALVRYFNEVYTVKQNDDFLAEKIKNRLLEMR